MTSKIFQRCSLRNDSIDKCARSMNGHLIGGVIKTFLQEAFLVHTSLKCESSEKWLIIEELRKVEIHCYRNLQYVHRQIVDFAAWFSQLKPARPTRGSRGSRVRGRHLTFSRHPTFPFWILKVVWTMGKKMAEHSAAIVFNVSLSGSKKTSKELHHDMVTISEHPDHVPDVPKQSPVWNCWWVSGKKDGPLEKPHHRNPWKTSESQTSISVACHFLHSWGQTSVWPTWLASSWWWNPKVIGCLSPSRKDTNPSGRVTRFRRLGSRLSPPPRKRIDLAAWRIDFSSRSRPSGWMLMDICRPSLVVWDSSLHKIHLKRDVFTIKVSQKTPLDVFWKFSGGTFWPQTMNPLNILEFSGWWVHPRITSSRLWNVWWKVVSPRTKNVPSPSECHLQRKFGRGSPSSASSWHAWRWRPTQPAWKSLVQWFFESQLWKLLNNSGAYFRNLWWSLLHQFFQGGCTNNGFASWGDPPRCRPWQGRWGLHAPPP